MSRYTRMRVEDMPSIPVGAKQSSSRGIVSDLWYLLLAAAPQPPVVNQPLTTYPPASVAPPALYQHDDGRYALALGDVARHKLTDNDPGWHRVPLDIISYDSGAQEEVR